jgi:hypothetical protein
MVLKGFILKQPDDYSVDTLHPEGEYLQGLVLVVD